MSLLDYLPLLKGWKYNNLTSVPNYTIKRGAAPSMMYDHELELGWILRFFFTTNDPDTIFKLYNQENDTGSENTLNSVPSTLFSLGLVNPNNKWPWVSVYNIMTNTYVVIFAPVDPWSYTGKIQISATLPPTAATASAIISFEVDSIIVNNLNNFLETLRPVQGGEIIPITPPPGTAPENIAVDAFPSRGLP
jgi:hypothetical protein